MDNELKLYIVRHGQTEWNVLEKFQGQLNSPLTLEGIEKVKKTAEKLKNIKFKAGYTSQMGRTFATAKIILQNNNYEQEKTSDQKLKLKKLPELNEIHFGEWQGMTFRETFLKFPKEAHNYFYDVKNYNAKNIKGEELKDGLERFLKGLEKIREEQKSGNILIVTHGTVLELFFNHIQNREADDLDERKLIGNGRYKIFTFENEKYIAL